MPSCGTTRFTRGFRGLGPRRRHDERCWSALSVEWPPCRSWTRPGSNRPPPVCKTGALPDELRALGTAAPTTVATLRQISTPIPVARPRPARRQRRRGRPRRRDDHAETEAGHRAGTFGARRRRPRWPGSASSPVQLARRSPYPPQPARVTAAPRPYFWDLRNRYSVVGNACTGGRNRTHDTRLWRPLLYHLSYARKSNIARVYRRPGKARRRKSRLSRRREGGGGNRDGVSRFASSLPGSATSWLVACIGPRGSRPRAWTCRHNRKTQHARPGQRAWRPATSSRSPFVRAPADSSNSRASAPA
jgi:hypothetical protein